MDVPPIEHLPARQRFQTVVEGHRCVVDYRLDGSLMHLVHTEVPPPVGGRGVAAALVRAALEEARRLGWRVNPLCSYVRVYMRRHPETQDLLV